MAKETIKLIVPYPAGGTSDRIARVLQTHLNTSSDYQFVIDYKVGAGGTIGASHVAAEKNEPLLLLGGQSIVISAVTGNVKYDLENDFTFLSCMTTDTIAIVAKNNNKINRYQDLLELAKTTAVPYGTSGLGTVQSMVSPIVVNRNKNHFEVPYKGAAEVMNALLADTIVWYIDSINLVSPQIDAGNFKLLGVSSKSKKYPDAPTFKELGINIHGFANRQLLMANNVLDKKLRDFIAKRLNEEALTVTLTQMGYDTCINTNNPNALKVEKDIINKILK